MVAIMRRIALCPEDGSEMDLQHRGFDMDTWYCGACGEHRTVLRRGAGPVPEAPLDALAPTAVKWVEREAPPLHGRIFDEEGG